MSDIACQPTLAFVAETKLLVYNVHFESPTIQLKEMWTELERLKKQIAYDAEEDQLKQNLAWAKVHVSEQESAALLERIAKKNEVMRLLIPSEGADTLQLLVTNFAFHTKLDISSPRTWQGPRRG